MNSWGRFSLTSEWNRCQRTHIIGWLIKLVQETALTKASLLFIYHLKPWNPIFILMGAIVANRYGSQVEAEDSTPVPHSNAYRLFNSKSGPEIAFGQKQNVFIFVSIVIKMWAWIPEEIKHKGRKQAEMKARLLKLRENDDTSTPLKTFYGAKRVGCGKRHLQGGKTEPREWAKGTALQ